MFGNKSPTPSSVAESINEIIWFTSIYAAVASTFIIKKRNALSQN